MSHGPSRTTHVALHEPFEHGARLAARDYLRPLDQVDRARPAPNRRPRGTPHPHRRARPAVVAAGPDRLVGLRRYACDRLVSAGRRVLAGGIDPAQRARRAHPRRGLRPARSADGSRPMQASAPSPGTASTARSRRSASSAVSNEPPRWWDSTTSTTSARPAMIRLRAGNRHGSGDVPRGASLRMAPWSRPAATATCSASGR